MFLQQDFHSPRSVSSDGSPRLSSNRSRASLDRELKNAPSYHHAIMLLLPHRSPLDPRPPPLLHPLHDAQKAEPPHGHRECLCDRERKQYRKDWRENRERNRRRSAPHRNIEGGMTMMQSETQSDSELEVNLNGGRDHGAASHFKSCTLYLEVKLAEMLSASKHSLTDPTRPDANRFSVCWQVPSFLSQKIGCLASCQG